MPDASPSPARATVLLRWVLGVLVLSFGLAACESYLTEVETGEDGLAGAPRLTFFSVSPDSADVSEGAALVRIEAGARGAAGIAAVEVVLDAPEGEDVVRCLAEAPASGDQEDGRWQCSFEFAAGGPRGRWSVQVVRIRGAEGQVVELGAEDLAQAGYPHELTVYRAPGIPTTLTVTPGTGVLTALEDRLALSATVLNQYDEPMPEVEVAWTSANPRVAAVDGDGVVRPLLPGSTVVVATAGDLQTRVPVQVNIQVAPDRIVVTPSELLVQELDGVHPFVATVYDQFDRPVEAEVAWSVSDPAVASVDARGVVQPRAAGSTWVIAALGALADSARLTVEPPREVARVELLPRELALDSVGDVGSLTATAYDAEGDPIPDVAFEWSTTDQYVAVAIGGVVTAIGPGVVVITARAGDVSGEAEVTVPGTTEVARIELEPATATLTEVGAEQAFVATAFDAEDVELPDVVFSWSSSTPAVATVDDAGLATAVGPGTTTIRAAAGGVLGEAELTVDIPRTPSTVVVTPEEVALFELGATRQLAATVLDQFGDPLELPVTWASGDETVVGVDGDGLLTAAGEGSTLVTATAGSASGVAQVTVELESAPGLTGELVFASERTGPRHIYRKDLSSGVVTALTSGPDEGTSPVWSPDGSRIAFIRDGDLWLMNADGSDPVRVTSGGTKGGPSWSPDGREIAYSDGVDGDWDIHVLELADPSEPRVVLDNPDNDRYVDWSPDGSELVFNRNHASIRTIGPFGDGETEVLSGSTRYTDWSPVGDVIAYSRFSAGSWYLETLDLGSSAFTVVTSPSSVYDWEPSWSPDGSQLAFIRNGLDPDLFADVFDLWVTDRDGLFEQLVEASSADDLAADWTSSVGTFGSPTTTITTPEADDITVDDGTTVFFEGTASDPEDGALTGFALEWRSDRDGLLGPGRTVTVTGLSQGTHEITFTAVDRGGRVGADTVVVNVVANQPPSVVIEAPADPTTVPPGTAVFFEASATDPEDGDIGEFIEWTSDLDGIFGAGTTASATLSEGVHTVTASVTDSEGLSSSASVTVVVSEPSTGALYGVDSSTDALHRFDPFSGQSVRIGTRLDAFGGTYSTPVAMAIAPATEEVLVFNNSPDSELLSVNVCSGAANSLGRYSRARAVGGIAYRPDGTLFLFDDDELLTIEAASGDLAVIGPVPIRFAGAAFTPDGRLFGIELTLATTVRLVEIDPTDASVIQSIDITGPGGVPLTPGLAGSLTWNPTTGQFLATAARNYEDVGSALYDLTTTGVATNPRATPDSDGLQGIGFRSVRACAGEGPTVTIDAPEDGFTTTATDPVRFEATATDPEDGTISAAVVWTSDLDGSLGRGSVNFSFLTAGTHTITASVQDSDGNPARSEGITVVVGAGSAPTVTILQPAEETVQVVQGTEVAFEATATDPGQGDISSALFWSSDIDGFIGSGASFTSTLSLGTHQIRALVTDSDGNVGEDTVVVEVVPPPTGPGPGG